jgi:hypothetical protein
LEHDSFGARFAGSRMIVRQARQRAVAGSASKRNATGEARKRLLKINEIGRNQYQMI